MRFNDNSDYFDTDSEPQDPQHDDPATEALTIAGDSPSESATTDSDDNRQEPTPKKRSGKFRRFIIWTCLVITLGLAATVYLRYFNPYVTDARATGLVVNVERRGILFKTFEADIAPDDAMTGVPQRYSREGFSFADDGLAHQLQKYQGTGTPVTVTYSRYFGILPWRGASQRVITSIDTDR